VSISVNKIGLSVSYEIVSNKIPISSTKIKNRDENRKLITVFFTQVGALDNHSIFL
jgi:hypothetical protein